MFSESFRSSIRSRRLSKIHELTVAQNKSKPIQSGKKSKLSSCAPRSGNEYTPHPNRPPVMARSRIFDWETEYSKKRQEEDETKWSPEIVDLAKSTIARSLHADTLTSYGAGLLRFTQYCDKLDIPESHRMPADRIILTAFIGAHVGSVGGKAVANWMSGLKMWHEYQGAPWHGNDAWVRMARTTANKEGTNFKRKPRDPVSMTHMKALKNGLDLTKPRDIAIWAIACTTFFGCRRLGETTIPSKAKFDKKFHVTNSTSYSIHALSDGNTSCTIRIPWTKTTKEQGAEIVLTGRMHDPDGICPVKALKAHLVTNASKIPSEFPLFSYSVDGKAYMIPKKDFLDRCHSIWSTASLHHILGHSFRIGGAVLLLLAGVPPEVVAATGGWTSLAFLLYWRRISEILPSSTSKAYSSRIVTDISSTMNSFRSQQGISQSLIDNAYEGQNSLISE